MAIEIETSEGSQAGRSRTAGTPGRACSLTAVWLMLQCRLPAVGGALLAGALLAGCEAHLNERTIEPAEIDKAVNRGLVAPITRVTTAGAFVLPPACTGRDLLPDGTAGTVRFNDYEVADALGDLLAEERFSVISDSSDLGVVTISASPSMTVADLVDEIARARNLFYEVEGQSLRLRKERTFTLKLPPVEEAFEDIAQTLTGMGATSVNLDKIARLVSFRSDRESYDKIAAYFDELADTSALLVYDTWIYEVELKDDLQTGINWQELSYTSGDGSTLVDFSGGTSVAGGFSLGVVTQGTSFAIDALLSFLETQGKVETLAKPSVSFLSGRAAEFNVGRKTDYISEISQASVGDDLVSSAKTETLETGLSMKISGDRAGDSVYTRVALSLKNLINFQTFDTGANQLALPDVSNRAINTETRSAAGAIIMIAGIVQERDEASREGIPILGDVLPLVAAKNNTSATKSELVILLRPRIVLFETGA